MSPGGMQEYGLMSFSAYSGSWEQGKILFCHGRKLKPSNEIDKPNGKRHAYLICLFDNMHRQKALKGKLTLRHNVIIGIKMSEIHYIIKTVTTTCNKHIDK